MTETATVNAEGTSVEASDNLGYKVVKFDGVIESFFGQKLPKALTYDTSYEELISYAAIPAKEMPDEDDILTFVNNKRKANERQKAMTTTIEVAAAEWEKENPGKAGNPYVKPTLETSETMQLKNMVDSMVASKKYTREQATVTAKQILGIA